LADYKGAFEELFEYLMDDETGFRKGERRYGMFLAKLGMLNHKYGLDFQNYLTAEYKEDNYDKV